MNDEQYTPSIINDFNKYLEEKSPDQVQGYLDAVLTITTQLNELFRTPTTSGGFISNSPSIVKTKLSLFCKEKEIFFKTSPIISLKSPKKELS